MNDKYHDIVVNEIKSNPNESSYSMSQRLHESCDELSVNAWRWRIRRLKKCSGIKSKQKFGVIDNHIGAKLPKILLLDIETAPSKAYVFSIWKQNIGINQLISDWFILTWAAKWLYDSEVFSRRLTPDEVKHEDDKRICTDLWHFVNSADVIIAHHGDSFDIPKINTRFLIHGMMPPAPYQTIDTRKIAAKQFGYTSNKLDYINRVLGLSLKIDTSGFELWASCMEAEESALKKMETYNVNDVLILEEEYVRIRPWIKSHPNIALYGDLTGLTCPNCGSNKINATNEFYYTPAGKYSVYRCECGATMRSRISALSKIQRNNLIISLAR